MSKTQRELLMLSGILIVLGGILYLRLGRGGESPSTVTVQNQGSQVQTTSLPGGVTPGTTPPGVLAQYPLEFLEPGLTDSAVTARIYGSSVGDPFARYRGRPTRTTQQTTRPQQRVPATPPPRQVIYLDDWPPQVRYQGVFQVAGSPGVFRARFNGRNVQLGEKISPTQYVLVDASPLLVRIRWEDERSNTIRIFRYLMQPPTPDL